MIKFFLALADAVVAIANMASVATTANATVIVAGDDVSRFVTLRNASINNGEFAGEIVKNSNDILRDVVLEIRYSWRCADEFHPGTDDPGRTVYYTAAREIPPGRSAHFQYQPSPPFPRGAMVPLRLT